MIAAMVYASPFILTTCEGVFGSVAAPTEIWRAGWKIALAPSDPVNLDAIDQYLTEIAPAVSAFHTSTNGVPNASDNAALVSLAGAHVGTDGKYLGGKAQPTTRYVYPVASFGTGTANKPLSTAICITLRTNILRGRAHAGRFYWPALALAVGPPSCVLTATQQGGLADKAKTLMDAVNAAAAAAWNDFANVSVMSNIDAGTTGTVERVEVGARLDSQERREKSIPEAYVGRDLAGAAALRRARAERLLRGEF